MITYFHFVMLSNMSKWRGGETEGFPHGIDLYNTNMEGSGSRSKNVMDFMQERWYFNACYNEKQFIKATVHPILLNVMLTV